jgi:biopolymer transport protein ExbB
MIPRLVVATILLAMNAAAACSGYSFRRSITVDHTKVPSTQTDFIVVVNVTNNDFKTTGNGGKITNASGFDISFCSDSAGATSLFWDLEPASFTGTSGNLVAWVRIPSLSNSSDTVFYVFYANAGISTYQSTRTSVWNGATTFDQVMHLGEAANPFVDTIGNSTSTGNFPDGAYPTQTAGQMGFGQSYSGGQSISGPTPYPSGSPGTWTLSGWMQSTNASNIAILYDSRNNALHDGTINYIDKSTGFAQLFILCSVGNPTGAGAVNLLNDGTWHYMVTMFNRGGDGISRIFVDGAQVASSGTGCSGNSFGTAASGYTIGDAFAAGSAFQKLDEIHVTQVGLTNDWITTEYNNQKNPGTFLTLGPQVPLSGTAGSRNGAIIMQ